ncbi:unnamed protein product [Clonostachys rosea]|uniref:Gfo/Idh/MocA-like oxidoreductase N-terminal domain-containing protein n=1 Tax=Bionectria ochroleuca TaxID=29856 RepID=A0ABY6U0S3_BIOOC|nr:unnamed protein product [Clonostachys rosea]
MAARAFNVGIVGYGSSAKIFHIPFLTQLPQFKLYGIVQRLPKPGNSAPADYPDIKHYTNYKDLIADPAVDLVVVGTPPDNHFELTKASLEAGKHVLTEKPFVPTSAAADELISIAKAQNRLLCVYQNRRWDSDFLTIKNLVAKGTLGRILQYDSHFARYNPEAPSNWSAGLQIEKGGSMVFDLGSHLIDQAYVLFGMPQTVHGRLLSQRNGGFDFQTPDSIAVELTYPDGLLVNIRTSVLSAEVVQPRFWVRGTKGSFQKWTLDPQEDQLIAGMKATDPGFGRDDSKNLRLTLVGEDNVPREAPAPGNEPVTYKAFYMELAKALASGEDKDVPVRATQARDVLRLIEAVIESAKMNRDVVIA